jgi:NAD(P)-dependent dehydrogenase (short-subunit alcohol dehydrogenase family)
MTDMFDLNGSVAVVTGASRGIGEAIASAFAERGAKVVVSSRKAGGCAAVAQRITDAEARRGRSSATVGDMEALGKLFATVERDYGRLDVLVNNARPTLITATCSTPISAPSRRPWTSTSAAISSHPCSADG